MSRGCAAAESPAGALIAAGFGIGLEGGREKVCPSAFPHGSYTLPRPVVLASVARVHLPRSPAPRRQVLLLGDSIAATGTGYFDDVQRTLQAAGRATVTNPRMYPQGSGFCGTSFGLVSTRAASSPL